MINIFTTSVKLFHLLSLPSHKFLLVSWTIACWSTCRSVALLWWKEILMAPVRLSLLSHWTEYILVLLTGSSPLNVCPFCCLSGRAQTQSSILANHWFCCSSVLTLTSKFRQLLIAALLLPECGMTSAHLHSYVPASPRACHLLVLYHHCSPPLPISMEGLLMVKLEASCPLLEFSSVSITLPSMLTSLKPGSCMGRSSFASTASLLMLLSTGISWFWKALNFEWN